MRYMCTCSMECIASHTHICQKMCQKLLFSVFIRILCISCHWEGNMYCCEDSIANLPLRFAHSHARTHTQKLTKCVPWHILGLSWTEKTRSNAAIFAMIYEFYFISFHFLSFCVSLSSCHSHSQRIQWHSDDILLLLLFCHWIFHINYILRKLQCVCGMAASTLSRNVRFVNW